MMATTHVFAALAVVVPVAVTAPTLATPLAVGAILGGLAPDIDLVLEHRRSFHFPVVGLAIVVPAVGLAIVAPSSLTAAVAAVAVAAWLHAASDAIGGGPEMDPWNDRSERAVYDHARGVWIRPRRWIRYDGAPEDAALAVALSIPTLVVFEGWVRVLALVGVAVSIGYALVRRRMVSWVPDWLE
ncbi:metal-dependent hydrolase [Salinadaptatus halalkaliphilus]|uniref:Metal-dependent hydrolase n=1 Tax=Salinadaptatus halalkaliphilus TaxID=2419781 RepID=A0A4S3TLX1_9EURY|nr:metal-dependent hydrolase [Salinadaptatus halalkaliphilus]THE65201.1 metal-dependent hydrolase [Salinadaptatus halalkaliphilus]